MIKRLLIKLLLRNERMAISVPEFAHKNKDLLVIVCDPKTDNIFVGHKDIIFSGKIKSAKGKKMHVVRDVLKHSRFKEEIDNFIVGLMEMMKIKLKENHHFFKLIDGALCNIAKKLRDDKQQGVRSPYAEQAGRTLEEQPKQ